MAASRRYLSRSGMSALIYLLLAVPAAAQDPRGIVVSTERLALVIGNSAYPSGPLRNPVHDAQDVSRVLSQLGFQVILKENVGRRSMEEAIRSFGRQLRHGGVGLFYFAGHGIQVGGRNYLIPIDAKIESEADVKYEAVDAGLVLGKMEDAKNQLNIVILDACRNNPFERSFRSTEQGLARMDAPKGALVAYATAPGEVAADGPDRNGVFTKHLIRHMQSPNLPLEQVLKRVRIDVAAETNQRQIPWESSSLMGDFYFKTEKSLASSEPHPSSAPSSAPAGAPAGAPASSSREPLAALPKPETTSSQASAAKPSLAIFPVYFSGRGRTPETMFEPVKQATLESLKKLAGSQSIFSLVYSFYESPNDSPYRKIPPEILNEKVADELWVKDSFFSSNKKPNLPLILGLGRKLGVDGVLLVDCGAEIGLYYVEVKTEKVFFKEISYHPSSAHTEIPKELKAFIASRQDYSVK